MKPCAFSIGVQVAALDVLDERSFEDLLIVEVDDADRHLAQARNLGGTQPAFAGDELKLIADGTHDQRLQDAVVP